MFMGFLSKIYLFFKPVKNSKVDQKKNTIVVINMEDEIKTLSAPKMMISEEELAEIQKNLDKCDPTKKEQKKQKERMARRFDYMCGLVYGGLPEKKGGLYVVTADDYLVAKYTQYTQTFITDLISHIITKSNILKEDIVFWFKGVHVTVKQDSNPSLVYLELYEAIYLTKNIDSDLVKNKEEGKNDAEKEQKRLEDVRVKNIANLQASKERRNAFRHRFKEREKP